MSKTLEEIRAEMEAGLNPQAAPEETEKPENVQDLLERLSKASGVPLEAMLRALDAAAPDAPEILPEGAKVYYTSFPNCGIMVQRGPAQAERVEFKGDRLVTTDPQVIEYLDGIVDKPGSTIYTRSNAHVSAEVQQMRAEIQAVAVRAHTRMVAAGEKVA